jgi:hypothetical protein
VAVAVPRPAAEIFWLAIAGCAIETTLATDSTPAASSRLVFMEGFLSVGPRRALDRTRSLSGLPRWLRYPASTGVWTRP